MSLVSPLRFVRRRPALCLLILVAILECWAIGSSINRSRSINRAMQELVESKGGMILGLPWIPKYIHLTDCPRFDDHDAVQLARLMQKSGGVQQIMLENTSVTLTGLTAIAGVPSIYSIVVSRSRFPDGELDVLQRLYPDTSIAALGDPNPDQNTSK